MKQEQKLGGAGAAGSGAKKGPSMAEEEAAENPKEMIKLVSKEGHEFSVEKQAAMVSNTIKSMLTGPGAPLRLLSPPAAQRRGLPLANIASPTVFDFKRGELVFFRRFSVFFEQNPTLNRKNSFRCAKRASFFFFFGRKKFFLSPKRASPTSSLYWPGANCRSRHLGRCGAYPARRLGH